MSSETSNNDYKPYNKLTPVTEKMHAITWDGNNATIMGTLLKIQEWVTRTGQFRLFIEHGAVRVGRYTMTRYTPLTDEVSAGIYTIFETRQTWEPVRRLRRRGGEGGDDQDRQALQTEPVPDRPGAHGLAAQRALSAGLVAWRRMEPVRRLRRRGLHLKA